MTPAGMCPHRNRSTTPVVCTPERDFPARPIRSPSSPEACEAGADRPTTRARESARLRHQPMAILVVPVGHRDRAAVAVTAACSRVDRPRPPAGRCNAKQLSNRAARPAETIRLPERAASLCRSYWGRSARAALLRSRRRKRASVSRFPRASSAMNRPTTGPCLNRCPESPATSTISLCSG